MKPLFDALSQQSETDGSAIALVETADGTLTAHSKRFDECYHSTKDGAFKESLKKHVEPGFSLIDPSKREIKILDICFGLGYNTLTTLWYCQTQNLDVRLRIFSPELDRPLVESLRRFPYPKVFASFSKVIEAVATDGVYEEGDIRIEVIFDDARAFLKRCDTTFDIVYQDAFSPKKNPLLWTKEYFEDLRAVVSDEVIVTTYSSATPVRMGMDESGFYLYEMPAEGVRKGTIASPRSDLPLQPIDMAQKRLRNPLAAPLWDRDFK